MPTMPDYFFAYTKNRVFESHFGGWYSSAVTPMVIRIRLLAPPKSMRSIIDPTRREQRHG
jgi:hypothetical protein